MVKSLIRTRDLFIRCLPPWIKISKFHLKPRTLFISVFADISRHIFAFWRVNLKNKRFGVKILVCIFPPILISLVYIFRSSISRLGTLFPACPSYTFFKIYCPGCGNTRSVQHLLEGDIIGSLKFNLSPAFAIVIGLLAYLELVSIAFGKHIRIVPRSRIFWAITIVAFSVYFLVRNFVNIN